MDFKEKIRSGVFAVTYEVGPPKGIDTSKLIRNASSAAARVDAFNVTDMQSSVMRLGSLAVCSILKRNGLDPVYQVTCRDRNRLALQSDILSAAALGIENILVLTGDYPTLGDHPEAKPVFDLDVIQLLSVVRALERGSDMNGHKLSGPPPKFCAGAVVNPGSEPLDLQIMQMEKKAAAGAEFFQTQAVFDPKTFEKFISMTRHIKVPVLAGIIFLRSAEMARYMNKNVSGICVPDDIIKEMESSGDKTARSAEIAARLIKEIKPMCQGLHLMPIGMDAAAVRVLNEAGL